MTDAPEKIWAESESGVAGVYGGWNHWQSRKPDLPYTPYTRDDVKEAEKRAAYLRGLEDAAKVADLHLGMVPGHHPDDPLDDDVAQGYGNAAFNIAFAIRALAKEGGK